MPRKPSKRNKRNRKSDSELVEQSRLLDKALDKACAGPWTGNPDFDPDPDETEEDSPHEAGSDSETGT